MRILQVTPTYWPATRYGGPISAVDGLARALVQAGHEVTVACTSVDGAGDVEDQGISPVDRAGVDVRYFPVPCLRRLYFSPALWSFVGNHIGDYDVMHLHSVYLFPTSAAAHHARRAGVPYVLSPRGMLVDDLIRRKSAMVKRAWIRLFERRNLADAMVHFTTALEAGEFRRLGLSFRDQRVIPNGVDIPDHDLSADLPALPERFILYLGRIDWMKNIGIVIGSLRHLDENIHLVVAGRDDLGLLHRELNRADEAIRDRVHVLGEVGEEKWGILRRALALVLVSRSENFANVVVEAASQGCPVVVSPEVGLSIEVTHTNAGVVCAPTEKDVANAVAIILCSRVDYQYRAHGMAEGFRWPRLVGEYTAMYHEARQV